MTEDELRRRADSLLISDDEHKTHLANLARLEEEIRQAWQETAKWREVADPIELEQWLSLFNQETDHENPGQGE